ncbi:hypothetical protein [Leptothermofonsia sp. ETS-13]|uniref:hypothetical protein n=1 Tax=Leptothermofonsia sp. ETS-13 TaxID=3035696 RepID=UPI003BA012EF
MNSDIKVLLEAIRDWRKACKQLEAAIPNGKTAEMNAERAQSRVLSILQEDSISEVLEQFVQSHYSRIALQNEVNNLEGDRDRIISIETRATQPLNLSRRDLNCIITSYLESNFEEKLDPNHSNFAELFAQLHKSIIDQYRISRDLPRKQKKQWKRKVTIGVTFSAIGLGLIAGNTQLSTSFSIYSYLLGGNALLQAIRDLIGEAVE